MDRPTSEVEDYQAPPVWQAWVETIAVTAGALGLSWLANQQDPFFLRANFTWMLLAPLLAGLRFGFAAGCSSALALDLALYLAARSDSYGVHHYPSGKAVGMLLVGMLAGEFCDAYSRRLGRLQSLNIYRRERLDEFTRSFFALKSSHDQLEQRLAGSAVSLREALNSARRQLIQSRVVMQALPGMAQSILEMLARYGYLQVAALHVITDGRVQAPLATLGQGKAAPLDDPLLLEAVRTGLLVSVDPKVAAADSHTELLAAIPLVDVTGRVWAVVSVREMLFIAFQDDNLRLLMVLGGHLGDLLADAGGLGIDPANAAEQMGRTLRRSLEDARRYKLPAAFLTLTCGGPEGARLAQQVLEMRRALDQAVLQRSASGEPVVQLLLPLTDRVGVDGYLSRLSKALGADMPGVAVEVHALTGSESADALLAAAGARRARG